MVVAFEALINTRAHTHTHSHTHAHTHTHPADGVHNMLLPDEEALMLGEAPQWQEQETMPSNSSGRHGVVFVG